MNGSNLDDNYNVGSSSVPIEKADMKITVYVDEGMEGQMQAWASQPMHRSQ